MASRRHVGIWLGVALATLAAVAPLPTSGAGAAPGAPAAPSAPAVPSGVPPVDPEALPSLGTHSAYAIQVLETFYPDDEPTREDILRVSERLDRQAPTLAVLSEALGTRWLVPQIEERYQRYLDRGTDPSGLDYWRRVVTGGASPPGAGSDLELLEVGLGASAEAWRRSGETNAGYVDWVYQRVLGRAADPSGKAFWTKRLDDGALRGYLVRALLRSNERATKLVDRLYLQVLRRRADAGGRASWVAKYRQQQIGEIRLMSSLLVSAEARRFGCDPFDDRLCLLPFPNDRFTVEDPTTATGRRVSFKPEWMPRNSKGVPVDPEEWNRNDGFSVGQAALLHVPGIDLDETGAVPLDDLGAYDDEDAPIVVLDADTGERHPIFVELDANIPAAEQAADQLLYIRPARNWEAGHRYIVVLRNLKRTDGSTIAAPESFRRYRDEDTEGLVGDAADRIVPMTFLLSQVADAGIDVTELFLAWDFTVASTNNTAGRALHIRDDALDHLDGDAAPFTVTSVQEAPDTGIARRIEGTFTVPTYLTGDSGPGQGFANGSDGLPVRQGTLTARFGCNLPDVEVGTQARPVVYGHGLFGAYTEVFSSSQRAMVRDHDMAYCATDWIGMSSPDVANAAVILQDLSSFGTLPDRSQQGFLNFIVLGRLMTLPDGFASHTAFQHAGGASRLDPDALFYDGNSQGAILGGAYLALSPDTESGVLGVAGMNYSTLLERSVDFDPFAALMKPNYPSATERVLGLGLIQMLWDRGEVNGYAAHIGGADPLVGSSPSRVLIHTALGDHQVATFTAEITARTAGMAIHRPVHGPGRTTDVDPGWGLPSIDYPSTGSALILWDSESPLAPIENVPPRAGRDPHGDPRAHPPAQEQKSEFLTVDGTIIDACGNAPCTIDK